MMQRILSSLLVLLAHVLRCERRPHEHKLDRKQDHEHEGEQMMQEGE